MTPQTGSCHTRINLVSSPRNISTALMYSFANRGDTSVVDEPFYGYYLSLTGEVHPGREEIIAQMRKDSISIIEEVVLGPCSTPYLFVKNMAHHLTGMDISFLQQLVNIFLIRDPRQLIASFSEIIPEPRMKDIGVARQWELFQWLLETTGTEPVVLDSGEVLVNPALVLGELCQRIGIPFSERMLQWEPGALPQDGVWAKYWYASVHRSSGFQRQYTTERDLPDGCRKLYEAAQPIYEQLFHYAIKA